jgi:V-type H+-transporting ATPase subunit C
MILDKSNQLDNSLKKSYTEYTDTKNMLSSMQKRTEGNYMSRDLLDLICSEGKCNPNDFVDTQYLCTAIAIVNKNQIEQWRFAYERLESFEYVDKSQGKTITCSAIVPGSLKSLDMMDKEGNCLYRVVLLKKNIAGFVTNAKSKAKVVVREFKYDKEKYEADKKKKAELIIKLKDLEGVIMRACQVTYSDLMLASMHMKMLRLHVESVLRWGIPPNYFACVIKPQSGKDKLLFKSLTALFAETKDIKVYGSKEEIGEAEDYYPFILIPFNSIAG